MSLSGSTRDLFKVINAFITSPKLPLPDDLTRVLEAYLDKHDDYDQAASDRLHQEFVSTFNKAVCHESPIHYASFLSVLSYLRPALRSQAHVLEWWEKLVEPILNHLGHERGQYTSEILGDIGNFLVPDEEDEKNSNDNGQGGTDGPNPVATRLLQKWMEASGAVQNEGFVEGWTREKPVQVILLLFGKRRPMHFFNALNAFFVQRDYRVRSINLLSEFVRSQPPHLHIVIRSPLFESLLRCLQFDTSTTVVSLALTSLIMLLPNMPSSIAPILPTLFNIYARLLFWERETLVPDEKGAGNNLPEPYATNPLWERCQYSPDDDDDMSIHHLLGYFTILYGLYPLNFMDYIRKPQRYLRHANATDADDVEVQPSEIRDRSEPFRRCHLLHPNFYNLTIESEKTDFGRWMRSATADVVSECVALHVPLEQFYAHHDSNAAAQRPAGAAARTPSVSGLLAEDDDQHEPILGRLASLDSGDVGRDVRLSTSTGIGSPLAGVRRSSQSSFPDAGGDSPTLPPLLSPSASRTDLQELIDSNKAIKTRLHQSLTSESVPSLSLSQHGSAGEPSVTFSKTAWRRSPTSAQFSDDRASGENDPKCSRSDDAVQMRRQILLLQNDLSFERYMVNQHLSHIGAMQRQNVKRAVTEAETQNLLLANRTLKHRLEEAKKVEAQVKKEAEMSRTRAKNWEESLASRLKKLREEHKRWTAEETTLQTELKIALDDNNRLVALVCEKEVRELKLEQDLRVLEASVSERDGLSEKVRRLAAAEQENRKLEDQLAQARGDVVKTENRLELLYLKLEAREDEFRKTRDYYQEQVAALNGKLAEVLRDGQPMYGGGGISNLADTKALVESALAASRAKHLELQKNHTRLTRQVKVLESKILERATMYDDQFAMGLRSDMSSIMSDPETEASGVLVGAGSVGSGGSSGGMMGRQRQRMASDAGSGSAEATSPGFWGAAPISTSLGSAVSGTTATNAAVRRPSTPSGQAGGGGGGGGNATGSTSPQAERYYGRGGVQNTARKERKDKKKDDTDKNKRSGGPGIRGIRGFV